jgi:ABC-type Zn uptake system ZnuABC Zn-binding protein ZnuA
MGLLLALLLVIRAPIEAEYLALESETRESTTASSQTETSSSRAPAQPIAPSAPNRHEGKVFRGHTTYVVTSTPFLADLVNEIGGYYVRTKSLVDSVREYESLTPQERHVDIVAAADLMLYHGYYHERKFEPMFQSLAEAGVAYSIEDALKPELLLPLSKHSQEPGKALLLNPALWSSPTRWQVVAEIVARELQARDPEHADFFQSNFNAYIHKLEELDLWARQNLYKIPKDRRSIITDPDYLAYFAYDYGFNVVPFRISTNVEQSMPLFFPRVFLFTLSKDRDHLLLDKHIDKDQNRLLVKSLRKYNLSIDIHPDLFLYSLKDPKGKRLTYLESFRKNTNAIIKILSHQ